MRWLNHKVQWNWNICKQFTIRLSPVLGHTSLTVTCRRVLIEILVSTDGADNMCLDLSSKWTLRQSCHLNVFYVRISVPRHKYSIFILRLAYHYIGLYWTIGSSKFTTRTVVVTVIYCALTCLKHINKFGFVIHGNIEKT